MARFTDSSYEDMMKQKPQVRREKTPSSFYPPGHPCYGCCYAVDKPCIGFCYREMFQNEKKKKGQ